MNARDREQKPNEREPSEESFFVAGGSLRPNAASYVTRGADTELYEGLRDGEFCYLLTPRQMGKSSLMVRTAARLRTEGARVFILDLTAIGRNLTSEQWYFDLLSLLGEQSGQEEQLEQHWAEHAQMGPLRRLMTAIRAILLEPTPAEIQNPESGIQNRTVIFIDEIDVVRSLPFSTDEFFAAIRECYNRRTVDPVYERLTFCLLGVASPTDLIQDPRITPFNIGRRIDLTDFTPDEAAPLAGGLRGAVSPLSHSDGRGAGGEGTVLLSRILYWTHGHPYLTQRLCRALAENPKSEIQNPKSVDTACATLFLTDKARERDDNLIFVRDRLLRSGEDLAALLERYRRVRRRGRVPDTAADPIVSLLKLAGIARAKKGTLRVRNRIYATVFDEVWIRENMPDADIRRERAAYRKGILRAATVGAGMVLVLGGWLATAVVLGERAERNRVRAERNQRAADQRTAEAQGLSRENQNRYEMERAAARANLARWHEVVRERDRANALGKQSRTRMVQLLMRNGARLLEEDDLSGALVWYTEALRLDPDPARQYMHRLRIGAIMAATPTPRFHWPSVASADLRMDGSQVVAGYADGTVKMWDAQTGATVGRPVHNGSGLTAVRFSPDGRYFASFGGAALRVWRSADVALVSAPQRGGSRIRFVEWSPDSRRVAVADDSGWVRLWRAADGAREVAALHSEVAQGLRFDPRGQHLAVPIFGNVWMCDTATGLPMLHQPLAHGDVTDVQFSPDGRTLVVAAGAEVAGADLPYLAAHETATQKPVPMPSRLGGGATSLSFAPAGGSGSERLLVTGLNGVATIWDLPTLRAVGSELRVGTRGGEARYTLDAKTIVSCADGAGVRLWDAETGEPLSAWINVDARSPTVRTDRSGRRLLVNDGDSNVRLWEVPVQRERSMPVDAACVALSPDGSTLATGDGHGYVRLWDVATGRIIRQLATGPTRWVDLAFRSDGGRLAGAGEDGFAHVWDVKTATELHRFPRIGRGGRVLFIKGDRLLSSTESRAMIYDLGSGRTLWDSGGKHPLDDVAVSPDGRAMALDWRGGDVVVRETSTGQPLWRHRHGDAVYTVVFSAGSRRLLTACNDRRTRIFDARTGSQIAPDIRGGDTVLDAAFSPEGRFVATAGGGRYVRGPRSARIYDSHTGRAVTPDMWHQAAVLHTNFSPDGRLLVTSSADHTARVWDARTGEPVSPILRMRGEVWAAEIAPNNRCVVAADNTGAVKIWPLAPAAGSPESLAALAQKLAARRIDSTGSLIPFNSSSKNLR